MRYDKNKKTVTSEIAITYLLLENKEILVLSSAVSRGSIRKDNDIFIGTHSTASTHSHWKVSVQERSVVLEKHSASM